MEVIFYFIFYCSFLIVICLRYYYNCFSSEYNQAERLLCVVEFVWRESFTGHSNIFPECFNHCTKHSQQCWTKICIFNKYKEEKSGRIQTQTVGHRIQAWIKTNENMVWLIISCGWRQRSVVMEETASLSPLATHNRMSKVNNQKK